MRAKCHSVSAKKKQKHTRRRGRPKPTRRTKTNESNFSSHSGLPGTIRAYLWVKKTTRTREHDWHSRRGLRTYWFCPARTKARGGSEGRRPLLHYDSNGILAFEAAKQAEAEGDCMANLRYGTKRRCRKSFAANAANSGLPGTIARGRVATRSCKVLSSTVKQKTKTTSEPQRNSIEVIRKSYLSA